MRNDLRRNTAIQISDRSHLNITINILSCGNCDIILGDHIQLVKSDAFTMCYLNEGVGLLEMDCSSVKITAQKGFVAFPNGRYTLKNIGEEILNVTWVSFTGYLIENYLGRANIIAARPQLSDEDGFIGEQINRLYTVSQTLPNRYCKMVSGLYSIFAFLLDHNPTNDSSEVGENAEFFVLKAIDYIDRNYANDISVEEVAEKLGISRKFLNKVFGRVLNIAPKKYIINVRIEKACTALRKSNQPIAELAESIGYANQFYFAREFKRLTNMTPTQYRNSTEEVVIEEFNSLVPILKEKYGYRSIG